MAGWLSKAREALRPPPEPEVPFDVACDCGGRATGLRGTTHLLGRCGTCHATVFVLPMNVYPAPPPPKLPKTRKPAAEPVHNPLAEERKPADKSSRTPGFLKRPRPTAAAASEPAIPVDVEGFVAPQPWNQRVRSWFTRFNLTMLTLGLVVLVTSGAILQHWRVSHARDFLAQWTESGEKAFENRDFAEAAKLLGQASRAVDLLGKRDSAANLLRIRAREAEAAAGMLHDDLPTTLKGYLERDRPAAFEAGEIRGRWLICDLPMKPVAETRWSKLPVKVKFELPLEVDGKTVKLIAHFTRKPHWWPKGDSPARLVFAVPIEGIEKGMNIPPGKEKVVNDAAPDPNDDPTRDESILQVKLRTDALFPWGTLENLKRAGWQPLDETESVKDMEQILATQRSWQGVEP